MLRPSLALVACLALPAQVLAQGLASEVVSAPLVQRYGMKRAWVTRAEVDPSRGRIAEVVLHGDVLYVQTNQAAIQAIHAETGRTLWVRHVGKPGYPAMAPAAHDEFVASCVGSTLYLLRSSDGSLVWERILENGPSAGLAMGADRVYVPLVNHAVVAYSLRAAREQQRRPENGEQDYPTSRYDPPLAFRAGAMSYSPPLLQGNLIAWGTADGYVYAAAADTMQPRFRFETRGPVNAPLAAWRDRILAASRDGYLYCMNNLRGTSRWQFSAGTPIEHQPVVIGDTVYVIPESGHMYALDARKGQLLWQTAQVAQFLAASEHRVYVFDLAGRIACLDNLTGNRVFSMPTGRMSLVLTNTQTDRIYVGSRTGILQCLREQARTQPLRHRPLPAPTGEAGQPAPSGEPTDGQPDEEQSDEPADDADEDMDADA